MKFYELSKPLHERSVFWPGQPALHFFDISTAARDGVLSQGVNTSLHNGTHIDAPLHFPKGSRQAVHEIPLETLCGTTVILDVARDDWGAVTADDLTNADPTIREGDRLILNFGWHRWLTGVDDEVDEQRFILKYPGLDRSAVDWIIDHKLAWVGSDTPSPDHAYSLRKTLTKFRPDVFTPEVLSSIDTDRWPLAYCHRTLLAAGIPMIEQLGGQIDEVTGERVQVFALPPRFVAEASQIRVVAVKES